MRIGLLSIIANTGIARELRAQASLASALKRRDHDVIEAVTGIATDVEAFREAERLARADCDGLAVLVEGSDVPALAALVAQRAQTPIVLIGGFGAPFFESANALEEIGIGYDRLPMRDIESVAASVEVWLTDHTRTVRQRGLEAAQSLYTQRYAVLIEQSAMVDEAQWLEQLGVEVKFYPLSTVHTWMDRIEPERVALLVDFLRFPDDGRRDSELQLYLALKDLCRSEHIHFCSLPEIADGIPTTLARSLMNDIVDAEGDKKSLVCAGDGDANGALTMQLLHLITGGEPVLSAAIGGYNEATGLFDLVLTEGGFPWSLSTVHSDVTFARITRRARRFVCTMLRGSLPDGLPTPVARFDIPAGDLFRSLTSHHLHAVPGNSVGALQAACIALDIDPLVLAAT